QAEDGIRDYKVTGVQTCALPISEQRIRRWAGRLGLDEEEARREVTRRMAAQWPDEKKIGAADFVIDNSGLLDETRRQVETVYSRSEERRVGKDGISSGAVEEAQW